MQDASELLDRFKNELPNQGTWYWDAKEGTRARLLVDITKMLKAGMDSETVKDVVVHMMFTGYVEHEKQVKAKTGMSVREFMEKKLTPAPIPAPAQEEKEHEHTSTSLSNG